MASRSSNRSSSLGTTNEVEKIFNKFDKNGDGKISHDELNDVLRALGSQTTSDEVSCIMSEIDKDGDGFISFGEFAKFYMNGSTTPESSTKELREAFDLYDLDKNGLISANELHEVLRRLGEKCTLVEYCSKMISSFDTDGDGHVNFEEFKNMMKQSSRT
ncbi:probable calcium-binding protein CML23 [Quercus robur]|uniref:probable calcium-binding protein CML23 n=1 Tax=Quercus robur TaxID=38942 RepID=UPI002163F067|nr:probable calcium-binding protein CML23 [Quercus robur]